jgi:hypothetical protein
VISGPGRSTGLDDSSSAHASAVCRARVLPEWKML